MSKPRLLDVFCGAGGCSKGYIDAGFEVVGVDAVPMPRYPFKFVQADALAVLAGLVEGVNPADFDVIHASPVCKGYTDCNLSPKERYLKQIGEVREHLIKIGKPYVIENVMGAKKDLQANLLLCASMFGLPMERHRLFEIGNVDTFILPPAPCNHKIAHISVVGHSVWDSRLEGTRRKDGRRRPDSVPLAIGREAMGISWMGIEELAQAIPPVYTEHIGRQLMMAVKREVAA
jgi:DNA (cytosine-5)-methyltransferase 1